MIFIVKIAIVCLALYVARKVFYLWKIGVQLHALRPGYDRDHLVIEKIEVWNSTVCLLVFLIIAVEAFVMQSARHHEITGFFLAHLVVAGTFVALFVLQRFRTGLRNPISHGFLGYLLLLCFLFVLLSGGWFLWKS